MAIVAALCLAPAVEAALPAGTVLPIPARAVAAPGASSAVAYTECQPRGALPGVSVSRRRHISGARACRVAMSFYRWYQKDRNYQKLYSCRSIGHPVLHVHEFDGWRLTAPSGYFTMSRGAASFVVTGQDFPLDCT